MIKFRIKEVVTETGLQYYHIEFKKYFSWNTLMNPGGAQTFWDLDAAIQKVQKLKDIGPPRVCYYDA